MVLKARHKCKNIQWTGYHHHFKRFVLMIHSAVVFMSNTEAIILNSVQINLCIHTDQIQKVFMFQRENNVSC